MGNKRNYQIDNIRALAILLVVFGHSIILYSSKWTLYTSSVSVPALDTLKIWISLIQMPLFFALSGFLFSLQYKKTTYGLLIKKKAKRLLIPYCFVGLCYMVPIKILVKCPGYENINFLKILMKIFLGKDNGHLWYLPCLFVCFMIAKLIFDFSFDSSNKNKFSPTVKIISVILFFSLFSIFSGKIGKMSVFHGIRLPKDIMKNFIWFYMGGCIQKKGKAFIDILNKRKIFVFILAIVMSALSIIYSRYFSFLAAFVLVVAYFTLVPKKYSKICDFLSKNSFGIYLFHSPLIYITFTFLSESSPLIVVSLNFLGFGLIALIITLLIQKTKFSFLIGM